MENIQDKRECPECGGSWEYEVFGKKYSHLIGVQYSYPNPEHYDGVSEWNCPHCGVRWGRWSGKILGEGESEKRFWA